MKRIVLIIISIGMFVQHSRADEGMWLLGLLEGNWAALHEMGLELSPEEIYAVNQSSMKDAIVKLGVGCTGSFISEKGLVLTNHHCAYFDAQSHSSPERDVLGNGYWATAPEEELSNPGQTASILVRMEEVTDQFSELIESDMDWDKRAVQISEIREGIRAEAEEGTHYKAEVKAMYGHNRYFLFVYEVFEDVRLVGIPPESIGNFGDDIDNWMWPRHSGDFAIYRVYSGPDGKPAPYAEENVPYRPKKHVRINTGGADSGQFVMVMGYPGGTDRYMTSYGVEYILEVKNPAAIAIRDKRMEILNEEMAKSREIRIKYSGKRASTSNYWKLMKGQQKDMRQLDVMGKKTAFENRYREWLKADPEREKRYGQALKDIQSYYEQTAVASRFGRYYFETLLLGNDYTLMAYRFRGLWQKYQDKGADYEPTGEELEALRKRVEGYYKNIEPEVEKRLLGELFQVFSDAFADDELPAYFTQVREEYDNDFSLWADDMFKESMFTDKEKLLAYLDAPGKAQLDNDPVFQMYYALWQHSAALSEESEPYNGPFHNARKLYLAGIMEMESDKQLYPDANGTLRLTAGTVRGYQPRDGVWYRWQTHAKGILEKEQGGEEVYQISDKHKEMIQEKDYGPYGENGQLPVCFLSDLDITGGNSGSPVFNGRGELIGLAFDGNWESVSGDIYFNVEKNRTISVDIRYVLWVIDHLAGAGRIMGELDIIKP